MRRFAIITFTCLASSSLLCAGDASRSVSYAELARRVEIIGHFSQDASRSEPLQVLGFDGRTALLDMVPTEIKRGQLVLIYDNEPTRGAWMFGIVSSIQDWPQPALTLVTPSAGSAPRCFAPTFVSAVVRFARPS